MDRSNITGNRNALPVAVVGRGDTLTARLLRGLTDSPVVELTPCRAVISRETGRYRAVVVEDFEPCDRRVLTPCAAVRWELARRADLVVVSLDSEEGRRLADCVPGRVFTYSDGQPRADLSAEQVRLREDRLEFEALTRNDLVRVRAGRYDRPRLYDHLAALAGALALGVPLEQAAKKLSMIV